MSSPVASFISKALVTFVAVAALLAPGVAQQPTRVTSDLYSQLRWRTIGPVTIGCRAR